MTGYYLDMSMPLEKIPEKFCSWIEQEITEDGLLEGVEQFIPTYRTHFEVDGTTIWVYKQDWTIPDDQIISLGCTSSVIEYPFEVAVIVQRPDIRDADRAAIRLQNKIITSVVKNYNPKIFDDLQDDPTNCDGCEHGYIENMYIRMGYNDGSLEAINQEEDVVIKGVLFVLKVNIDWIKCCKKINNNNGG